MDKFNILMPNIEFTEERIDKLFELTSSESPEDYMAIFIHLLADIQRMYEAYPEEASNTLDYIIYHVGKKLGLISEKDSNTFEFNDEFRDHEALAIILMGAKEIDEL